MSKKSPATSLSTRTLLLSEYRHAYRVEGARTQVQLCAARDTGAPPARSRAVPARRARYRSRRAACRQPAKNDAATDENVAECGSRIQSPL